LKPAQAGLVSNVTNITKDELFAVEATYLLIICISKVTNVFLVFFKLPQKIYLYAQMQN
jgi:hypothetical protein